MPDLRMALEARTTTLEEVNPELQDMTRRFRSSALITAPIVAFMISEFLPGQPLQRSLPHGWMNWIQFALATPMVLWGGWPPRLPVRHTDACAFTMRPMTPRSSWIATTSGPSMTSSVCVSI